MDVFKLVVDELVRATGRSSVMTGETELFDGDLALTSIEFLNVALAIEAKLGVNMRALEWDPGQLRTIDDLARWTRQALMSMRVA